MLNISHSEDDFKDTFTYVKIAPYKGLKPRSVTYVGNPQIIINPSEVYYSICLQKIPDR